MNHLIAQAVEPLRADAVQRAEKEATAIVERVIGAMKAVDWNIDLYAPYPKTWERDYKAKLTRRDLAKKLTTWTQPSRSMNEPDIRKQCPEHEQAFIKEAKEDASAQYDAFIAKLSAKIGDCTSAVLTGNHVWGYSFLTVTKADGTTECWKTQQIVNVSKFNKLFNQWPSRKVK